MMAYRFLLFLITVLLCNISFASRIYIVNAQFTYNEAGPMIIQAIEDAGHTVDIDVISWGDTPSLPAGFTTACIDPVNGYDWLCFFGDFNYTPLIPEIQAYLDLGGKVYYQYEVSCCTTSSQSVADVLSAVTGLVITPNINEYIALGGAPAWEAADLGGGCVTIQGNAYKGLDGLPEANQYQATANLFGSSPDINVCLNFGFVFTGNDFLNAGAITGVGDVNAWYNGGEQGAQAVNAEMVQYFFPSDAAPCDDFDVTCSSDPEVDLGPDLLLCAPDTVILDVGTIGASYLWQDNSTESSYTVTETGTYWVELTSDGITVSDTVTITFETLTTAISADTTICVGQSADLWASGGLTYSWTPTTTLDNANIDSPVATPVVTTTYEVLISGEVCQVIEEVTVTVTPAEITYDFVSTAVICETPGELIVQNISGPYPPFIVFFNGVQENDATVSPAIADDYALQIIDALGCVLSDDLEVADDSYDIALGITSIDPICETPGSIQVEILNGLPPFEILINTIPYPDGNIQDLIAGNYDIDVTDLHGCEGEETQALFLLENEIDASITTGISICETPGTLDEVIVSGASLPYTMLVDDELVFENDVIDIEPGDHVLHITDNDGCNSYHEFTVEWINHTEAEFTADPVIGEYPLDVTFTNSSVNATQWNWDFGNGEISSDENTFFEYQFPGNYLVVLTAIDEINGCADSDSLLITVKPQPAIYLPNCFTPDADGVNEVFGVSGTGILEEDFSLTIYNRAGDQIWQTTSPYRYWTGSYQDNEHFVPNGVYVYVVEFHFEGSTEIDSLKGHVTLIR